MVCIMKGNWAGKCEERMDEPAASYLECAEKGLIERFYPSFESVEDLGFANRYLGYILIRQLSDRGLGAGSASRDAWERGG